MKNLSFLLFFILIISCGTIVNYDYDQETNFSQYKSYNFFPDIDSGLSELDNKRIIYVTDSLLQARGFVKSENPNFLINFFAKEFISESNSSIGIGVGGGGSSGSIGVSGGIPIGGRKINQLLTIDFIDTSKDILFWQAVSDAEFKEKTTPTQKEAYYIKLIGKILKGYPPKK